MNKTGLVNEVKSQLGVSTAKAKSLVDAIFDEMAAALSHGEAITLRGFGFTPDSDRAWQAATDTVSKPRGSADKTTGSKASESKSASGSASGSASEPTAHRPAVAAPVEPHLVPYEPMHNPVEDALAAVAAEASRPEMVADPIGETSRVIASMPEPELIAAPDTLAYSSGSADTDETIGELTSHADNGDADGMGRGEL